VKVLSSKKPIASQTIKTEVVCPNDTNPMGILQGGRLVQWMDIAAAVSAQTHAETICVTASIDQVLFKNPARSGDIIIIRSKLTRAFNTSMEVFVDAIAKNIRTQKKKLISTGYFTFVALNKDAQSASVPAITPVSKEEKLQFAQAAKRRRKNVLQSEPADIPELAIQ
jgi:acyl-CoA hydrolase